MHQIRCPVPARSPGFTVTPSSHLVRCHAPKPFGSRHPPLLAPAPSAKLVYAQTKNPRPLTTPTLRQNFNTSSPAGAHAKYEPAVKVCPEPARRQPARFPRPLDDPRTSAPRPVRTFSGIPAVTESTFLPVGQRFWRNRNAAQPRRVEVTASSNFTETPRPCRL